MFEQAKTPQVSSNKLPNTAEICGDPVNVSVKQSHMQEKNSTYAHKVNTAFAEVITAFVIISDVFLILLVGGI